MPTHTAPTTAAITPPSQPRGTSSIICNMKQPKPSTCQMELLVDVADTELGEIKPIARVWKNDTGDHTYHFGKLLPSFLTESGACGLRSYTLLLFSAYTRVLMQRLPQNYHPVVEAWLVRRRQLGVLMSHCISHLNVHMYVPHRCYTLRHVRPRQQTLG